MNKDRGGKWRHPLGKQKFYRDTGIKEADWHGKYWARWGDALREAGFRPNEMQTAYADNLLIERLIDLIREVGRFPVIGELKLKARTPVLFQATMYSHDWARSSNWLVEFSNIARIMMAWTT